MSSATRVNAAARQMAMAAAAAVEVGTTGLVRYASRGEVLVIGDSEAVEMAPRLAESGLKVQVLMTGGEDQPGYPTVPQGGRSLMLTGYLGAFSVELGEAGKASHEVLKADLVLDLGQQQLIASPLSPPGYVHACADNELEIAAAVDALAGLKGTFEKPRYFDYEPTMCAHKNNGVEGCRQCIDACPADAIISIKERIEVNPNLCQGGGVCATVCPTGAIRYAYPSREDNLGRLHKMLNTYQQEGGVEPVLAVIAEADFRGVETLADNVLPLVVEELASIGLEFWLMALALGVTRVELHRGSLEMPRVLNALTGQVLVADALLEGLGYPAGLVTLHRHGSGITQMPAMPRSPLPNLVHKRQFAWFAIDHLYRNGTRPREIIDMPQGTPFGRIEVDPSACTLCMACTTVCPVQAVRAGNDSPRLVFHESECVQCGMCAKSCPEKAINLLPRVIADAERRRRSTVLHEEPPFCCIQCGKPFGSRSAVNKIIEKLSGHPMFQSERAVSRLKMCDDCRVVDIVQDDDMMGVKGFH